MIKENKEEFQSEMEKIKDLEWEKQSEVINEILENGISEYIKNNEINLEEGKEKEQTEKTLGCIDERVNNGVEITLAGSGILFDKDELKKFIKENNIKIITTHKNCGAAQMKFHNLTQEQADEEAKKYMQMIVKELNEKSYKIKHIYINEVEPDYHNARIIYFNNIEKFNPAKIENLPLGFVIEKFVNIENNARKELKIAISIAFGDHGFKDKFTKENPLIIACCLNENDNSEEIKGEINKILNEMENEFKDIKNIKERIKIDYFFVPAKK